MISLVCFYETMPLFNSIVVTKDSAVIPGELQFPIRKDHKVSGGYEDHDP